MKPTGDFNLEDHIASLPDPTKDKMPPRVGFTKEGEAQARADKAFLASLLDPKRDTERAVKYVLQGPLFGGNFRKDGDWVTLAGGRQVWQKKVSDLVGGVTVGKRPNALVYAEVKGISPRQTFAFSRLDKANNPRQPSQQTKLTREWERGNLVWLALGWWDTLPGKEPVRVQQKTRTLTRWKKVDVELTIYLLRWQDWLEIHGSHKVRSLRKKDRGLLDSFRIKKVRGLWTLAPDHWWRTYDVG